MKINSWKKHIFAWVRSTLVGLVLVPALAQAQNVPNVTYQGPITITKGGTYTGNYRSTDSGTPAVTIATSAPVTLQGCVIVGPGDLIQANGVPADITVLNSQGFGTTPTQDNRYRGRFVAASNAKNIRAENNYLEHTTGFTIYRFSGDGSTGQTVRILHNKVLNIDGRTRNGGVQLANFIGLNTVRAVGNIEIAWNQVINEPNLSSVEDNINFYNSGGTAQSPARVHDNYVQGAYPFPATSSTYSGTGMTTDGDGTTASTVPAYLNAYNNQFISTCNAGMNIAAGHDISYYNNRIVTSGLLPDGTPLRAVYAATAVFNGHQVASNVFYNNTIRDNTIGYRSPGYTIPFPDRHDLSNGACATCTGTTHLPNPITLSTEQNEFTLWQQKLKQNGIVPGIFGSAPPTPPTNAAPVVSLSTPANATVGAALTLTATASDADGTVTKVEFFSGTTKLGEDLTAPYTLSFIPTAAGALSLTARATDNAGATTTSAAVNVTSAPAPPAPPVPTAGTFYRALNLGGAALTIDGHAWEAAAGASGFSTNAPAWASPGSALNPATDAARATMLTSALFGTGPTLALRVPNGSYGVYLYIWENDNPTTVNVLVEGQTVRTGYSTGNAGHWERLGPFAANVTDGTLDVATTGGNVNLAGLEIYQGASANVAPVVSLITPTNATVGAALTLTATASDADGTVTKVEFFSGTTKLGEDLTAPYTLSFTPAAAGSLSLTARATDNAKATTTSAAVALTVAPAPAVFYRALNLGGAALTIDGHAWEAAAGASGFSTNAPAWASPGSALNPATDAARATMLTSALFGTGPTLALRVPNGSYGVYLYIWENDNPTTVNVLVEGQTVRTGYSTGSAGHWERLGPFAANVTDGTLDVATTGGNVNLAGLEIYQGTVITSTRANLTAPTAASSTSGLSLYPNPVIGSTQLLLPVTKAEAVEIGIYTMQGNILSRQQIKVGPNTPSLPIPTNTLVPGNYILRVLSGSQRGNSIQFVKE